MSGDTGVFKALAHPARRQILEDLRPGEPTAGEITSRFTISGPSTSRHLRVLNPAGLVTERQGADRITHSLVEQRLALRLGGFMSSICPEQVVVHQRRKKTAPGR